jgi:hypothetical protein
MHFYGTSPVCSFYLALLKFSLSRSCNVCEVYAVRCAIVHITPSTIAMADDPICNRIVVARRHDEPSFYHVNWDASKMGRPAFVVQLQRVILANWSGR